MEPIRKFIDKLQAGAGVDPAASQIVPGVKCENCQDLGYIRADLPGNHPLFGRLFPCPKCNQRVLSQPDGYGLMPADRLLAWDDIVPTIDKSITNAMNVIRRTLGQGYGWVYLWGGYGTAKTMLLKIAVAEYLRTQAEQAVYLRMADLMDDIRLAYDSKYPSVEIQNKIRWYSSLPLLAIDEFEKVNNTDFVDERRFQIMDARYEAATRQGYGVTLIASNQSPEKMPGAIASRLKDERFTVVHITADDVRLIAKDLEK